MQDKQSIKELSDEIIGEMQAWNASHPKATLLEIEVKARDLISQLEARLIEDSALERERDEWSQREESERPTCPTCQPAPPVAGQARPTVTSNRRQSHSPGKNLRHLSQMRHRVFPPSMSN